MSAARLPEGLLLTWYGDDFTGSTDVMEVLTFAGLPAVLFLDPPAPSDLGRFPGCRAVGVAGTARSRPPAWMREHLPPVFRALDALGAPVLQYKVCSTFDSSPRVGSIGTALELGLAVRRGSWSPIVVGAPALGRYQAFGNLFAVFEGEHFRLDRHPTMARHPVTPMREADLRLHLAEQTDLPLGLVDLVAMKRDRAEEERAHQLEAGRHVQFLDVVDEETLREAGRLVWEHTGDGLFTVSSSGLEYALVAHWRAAGLLADAPRPDPLPPVDRLLVVSGSCSPATAAQIAWFGERGAAVRDLDPVAALDPGMRERAVTGAVTFAAARLGEGRDVVLCTARGPEDPAIGRFREAIRSRGLPEEEAQAAIGRMLGEVLARLLDRCRLRRVVVCGGDTSGHAASRLGVRALTALVPLAPGSPLCRAWSDDPARDGLEIVLKGGQVGGPGYFGLVKSGGRR